MNIATEWSRTLVFAAHEAGVRDVIISPGSRSTPLAWAFAEHGGFRVHSIIDERAAAFFALGTAKRSGKPAVVVCTSGSAPAHYFPAVLEAEAAAVPLIILSADRPLSLSQNGAPQTTDQVKLFGDHVRWFFDVGEPVATADGFRMVRRALHQAVFAATHPLPGPVHLNARFRKPLEPGPAVTDDDRRAEGFAAAVRSKPLVAPRPARALADDAAVAQAAEAVGKATRGVVVVGELPARSVHHTGSAVHDAVAKFAARTGFAVAAEAVSQGRYCRAEGVTYLPSADALLRSKRFAELLAPEVIVSLGETPVSGAWQTFLEGTPARRIVLTDGPWRDPSASADQLLAGDPIDALTRMAEHVKPRAQGPWHASLARAEAAAASATARLLDAQPFFEGTATADLMDALPAGALLGLGNSLPVRLVDAWTSAQPKHLTLFSQRGVSGIDGTVAGFAGAARIHGGSAALLLGDITLLHDLTSLALLRTVTEPTVVLVLHNDGGRIFEQLPAATNTDVSPHFHLWTTPHGVSFGPAAQMFGLAHAKVADRPSLRTALTTAFAHRGATVIEAQVKPSGAIAAHRALLELTDELLRASEP